MGERYSTRSLRQHIVFADHSLATDSVFAEVQLVSCRNVLIYFNRDLQDRAIGLFRDALCRQGFLGIGAKESLRFSALCGRLRGDRRDQPHLSQSARRREPAARRQRRQTWPRASTPSSSAPPPAAWRRSPRCCRHCRRPRAPPFSSCCICRASDRSVLAEIFAPQCALAVKEAEDKDPVQPGTIYFAPPDYHLLLEQGPQIALSVDEPVHFSRPSIDVLFESAADLYRQRLWASS